MVFALAILAVALAFQPIQGPQEERTSEGGDTQNAATAEHINKSQEPSHPTSAPITSQISAERSKPSTDHDANDVNIQRNIEIFTGVLAGVGALQLVVMFLTWRVYRRQAYEMRRQRHEMRRQRHVMYRQWKAMRAQLGQMETASLQTEQMIEQAKNSANAARDNAKAAIAATAAAEKNLDIFISKERARITVDTPTQFGIPYVDNSDSHGMGGPCFIQFRVLVSGLTAAYILNTEAVCGVSAESDKPPNEVLFRPGIQKFPSIINPTETNVFEAKAFFFPLLTEKEIEGICSDKLFVHFSGYIKYRDVFYDVSKADRETRFHYIWRYATVPAVVKHASGIWLQTGKVEDNQET